MDKYKVKLMVHASRDLDDAILGLDEMYEKRQGKSAQKAKRKQK